MKFLMHLGSSTIQYALCRKDKIEEFNYVVIDNLNENNILQYIEKNKKLIKEIYVTSVSQLFDGLLRSIPEMLNLKWNYIKLRDIPSLKIAEDAEHELGIDIMLAMWNASQATGNVILIDFGQLTKIYKMVNFEIKGGVLLPSTQLQIRNVIRTVSRINSFKKETISDDLVGLNNNQALTIGVIYGQMYIVNHIINTYLKDNCKYEVIVTGGFFNDEILKSQLTFEYKYDVSYTITAMNAFINQKNAKTKVRLTRVKSEEPIAIPTSVEATPIATPTSVEATPIATPTPVSATASIAETEEKNETL